MAGMQVRERRGGRGGILRQAPAHGGDGRRALWGHRLPIISPGARWPWLSLLACVLCLPLLVACGSHGSAEALGAPAHVSLAWSGGQSAGSATLTPFYATHVVTYLGAVEVPYQGAKQPVQLRHGDCAGPVMAALTADAPVPSGTQSPLVQPDRSGGVDVATDPSGDLWITVLDSTQANATLFACGHPLSGNKQYFDLLSVIPSHEGLLLGHTLGTALTEPIIASRVDLSLSQSSAGPLAWAVHSGSCSGQTVASGQFPSGTSRGGIAFEAPDTSSWWLSVTSGDGSSAKTACGKIGA